MKMMVFTGSSVTSWLVSSYGWLVKLSVTQPAKPEMDRWLLDGE